ncbi:MAG: hypothetical protein LBP51_02175 [Deferribacteraceae bacterium]|jgi:hypothetical protein|nr:hypothetical protein [Deferribacteraceae bacterium]
MNSKKAVIDKVDDELLMRRLVSCRNDPLKFVEDIIDWKQAKGGAPDRWQRELLASVRDRLNDPNRTGALQYAVASGHGVGKSALSAWLALWAISCKPNLAGVITANTRSQLVGKTWRELAVWHKRLFNAHWFTWTRERFSLKDNPDVFISAAAWSKVCPEAFAGLHAENTLMIFDEASAIDDIIWENADGAMTTEGALWFVFGNPTRNTGRFRRAFGDLSHRWHRFRVDSRTAVMTDKAQIEGWAKDFGDDSDFFRIRVKGEFPRSGSNQFIPADRLDAAIKREIPLTDVLYAPIIIGVDVARFGEDASAVAVRRGYKLLLLKRFRSLDTMTFAEIIAAMIEEFKPAQLFVDETGIGAGVVDRLHQLGFSSVIGVAFSGASSKRKYFNKRTEMWGDMGEWLKNADIPDDRDLKEELAAPSYTFREERILLEKKDDMKKRGLSSPDAADALALTFALPISIETVDKRGVDELSTGAW